MMAIAAPGLVLFSLSFGLVDLFVGAAFSILPAAQGLVVGIALIAREALRVRRIRKLQDLGASCRIGRSGPSEPECGSWA